MWALFKWNIIIIIIIIIIKKENEKDSKSYTDEKSI